MGNTYSIGIALGVNGGLWAVRSALARRLSMEGEGGFRGKGFACGGLKCAENMLGNSVGRVTGGRG